MSLSRTSQCVFCTFKQTIKAPVPKRNFHASSSQLLPRRRQGNEPAAISKEAIKPYSEEERKILREKFTDAQIAALEAGEQAIPPEDIANQAARRSDVWSLRYFDDLSKVDAVVDKPPRAPYSNFDHKSRIKSQDEFDRDIGNLIEQLPEKATFEDYKKLEQQIRLTTGKEEAEKNPRSAMAPELFEEGEQFDRDGEVIQVKKKKPGKRQADGARGHEEITPNLMRLMQMTGYSQQQIKGFRVKSVVTRFVVNQTRLGKIRKASILTVAGNGNGLIGIGEGKSMEMNEALLQSQNRAIRNMRPILRYENRTIYGDVKGKVGATELELFNRPPGFGLRCSQYIYEIAKCAGISDLAARVTRARNPMNTVKAAVEALTKQKDPEDIARARGRKMVDVRKVYYAGGLSS